MKEIKQYLTHCSGFYSFISWLNEQQNSGFPFDLLNNVIYINPLFSQYISMGASTLKRNNGEAFLAVPPKEAKWLNMIQWTEIVFKVDDNFIYLLSHGVKSPTTQYPDLPGFTIAFYVDLKDKIAALYSQKQLLIREYRMEDDNGVYINYHNAVCQLPVRILGPNEDIKNINNVSSYDSFLAGQYDAMLQAGNRFDPSRY